MTAAVGPHVGCDGQGHQGGALIRSEEKEDQGQGHKQEVTREQHSGSEEAQVPRIPCHGIPVDIMEKSSWGAGVIPQDRILKDPDPVCL